MPRKIVGAAFVSLDGVMQAPGGTDEDTTGGFEHGGWFAALFEEAVGNQVDTFLKPPFDLLLGRRTYDIFSAYWPHQSLDEPIAAAFDTCAKYVLTSSDTPLSWKRSHRLPDIDALAALKQEDGPDLVIQGSSTLYPQLLERGLIDRLILMVAPLTLGGGKRLLGEGTPAIRFKPIEQRIGATGTVISTLEPAGPLETGSFADQEPSEAELERRARIAEGTW